MAVAHDWQETIREVRERTDIVELVSEQVDLKRQGTLYKGKCPFHSEHTPSFVVYPDSGHWVCFGCGERGDVFDWVTRTEGGNFHDALRLLADRVSVTLPDVDTAPPDPTVNTSYRLHEIAQDFFTHHLLISPLGTQARRFVSERGLQSATVERFGIGYAPHGPDTFLNHCVNQGFSAASLVLAGLAGEKDGRFYDRFRNRLMFPVRDAFGRIVGFGGRTLGEAQPKYLNSPASAIFTKGTLLYGLREARQSIRRAERVILVEGYMDTVLTSQIGTHNVVAQMGTALTDEQARGLRALTGAVVLCLDGDNAGAESTAKGIERLLGLGADVLVADLPVGTDPGDLAVQDEVGFKSLLAAPTPYLSWLIHRGCATCVTPADYGRVVRELTPHLNVVRDPIEREGYLRELATGTNVAIDVLREAVTGRVTRRAVVPQERRDTPLRPPVPAGGVVRVYAPDSPIPTLLEAIAAASEDEEVQRCLLAELVVALNAEKTPPPVSPYFPDTRTVNDDESASRNGQGRQGKEFWSSAFSAARSRAKERRGTDAPRPERFVQGTIT